MPKAKNQIIIYKSTNESSELSVHLENEDVWLSQQQMAELYQSSRTNVVEHIKNIKNLLKSVLISVNQC